MSETTTVPELARRAQAAVPALAAATTAEKNAGLRAAADHLEADRDGILEANAQDVAQGETDGMTPASWTACSWMPGGLLEWLLDCERLPTSPIPWVG